MSAISPTPADPQPIATGGTLPASGPAADDPLAPAPEQVTLSDAQLLAPARLGRPPSATRELFLPYAISFAMVHALALLALSPWFFSWSGVALAVAGYFLIGAVGINIAYHRLLTHRGFECPKWFERTLALIGVMNLQDGPARWVAIHRMHHQYSDAERDPHSPLVDFFWGHMGWLIWQNKYFGSSDFYDRYARDLLRDRFYMQIERNFMWFWIYVIHAAVFYAAGVVTGAWWTGSWDGGVRLGLSWLVWGVFVRTVAVWHVTWAVNSVTHVWGYTNYETRDESRNNWLIALLTSGEGWHNNHHAHPRCASHGHRWWELDFSYWTIRLFEAVGLAKQVVHKDPDKMVG